MKKLLPSKIFCVTLTLLIFSSCRKEAVEDIPNPYIKKINAWIDNKKITKPSDAERIEQLQAYLNYAAMREELSARNEKLLIIPIADGYKTERHISQNVAANLLVIVNAGGEVRNANVVLYTPKVRQSVSRVPVNTFQNIMTTAMGVEDGLYVFCNLAGVRNYQLKYDGGVLREQGLVQDKYPGSSSVRVNSAYRTLFTCWHVYLVTTYYDEYGNVTGETEDYLFSYGNCNGGGTPPGENQIPQPDPGGGGDVGYQYEHAKVTYRTWPVMSINDTTTVYSRNSFTTQYDQFITMIGFAGSGYSHCPINSTLQGTGSATIAPTFTTATTTWTGSLTYAQSPFNPLPVTGSKPWTIAEVR